LYTEDNFSRLRWGRILGVHCLIDVKPAYRRASSVVVR